MSLKVRMVPHISQFDGYESGIKRVVEAYFKYLPQFDIELVEPGASADLIASHAGILGGDCDIAHLHGIYFTADYQAAYNEWMTNRNVIQSALVAKLVTVPSSWVAKTFQRDMRIQPEVLPHGIEADLWRHSEPHENYVLWNKNRKGDVCDPTPIGRLAELAPDVLFASTFAPNIERPNLKIIGTMPHDLMKQVVQRAAVYLSTTKETFGIGTLEALAAGTPVLGWAYGGNLDLVEHGVTGYLAQPGNYDDLADGLTYCIQYRKELSANAAISAKKWTWYNVVERLAELYRSVAQPEPPTVSVVIPVYNKTVEEVSRAVNSALGQTRLPDQVIVIDDCSNNSEQLLEAIPMLGMIDRVKYIKTPSNSGVANARNLGIANTDSKYICCLDADDEIEPTFLETLIPYLEKHKHVGIAYTKLKWIKPNGESGISDWPPSDYNYERTLEKFNQIPTCNVFRRKVWEKLGGYRQRYAPYGAGEEDAEFWLRIGSIGYTAALVSEEPLFLYHTGSNTVGGNPNHTQTDWLAWHPWVKDKQYPFASIAKPTNERSHPVRQYDEPIVSFIIPVAPWHLPYLVDALDSLEAQTYRPWEVICIFDGLPQDLKLYSRLLKAYPYITVIENFNPPKGAGWARDVGVKASKGKFIVFLDADDYLAPTFLEKTLKAWNQHKAIIYTDYVDRAIWKKEDYDALPQERKLFYNDKTHEAIIRRFSKKYDWDEAIRQPEYNPNDANAPFYNWCIVTTLMPKLWYYEVGGLDTSMDTWEDVDLQWRLARSGKCFVRVEEPLVTYRFTSGSRREHGMVRDAGTARTFKERIDYLKKKYEGIPIVPCNGCGGNQPSRLATQVFTQMFNPSQQQAGRGFADMNDNEMIECEYHHPNMGMHPVIGAATGKNYGYHSGGNTETFLVNVRDKDAQPDIFKEKPKIVPVEESIAQESNVPPPPPKVGDFEGLSGVSKETEAKLLAAEIFNAEDILQAGKAGLERAGVAPRVATLILNSAKKHVA